MSLSCNSNVIKSDTLVVKGKKNLTTNVNSAKSIELNSSIEKLFLEAEEEIQKKILDAENTCEALIKAAKDKSNVIIENSKNQVEDIEKKAYEEGYSQGIKNGYEDGYKEAYEENIEKAKKEAEIIIDNSKQILIESKNQLLEYMVGNKENIIALSVCIAEKVLREKIKETNALDNLVTSTIEEYSLKENFVIRANNLYKESLNKQIDKLKQEYKLNSEVFVLADESIDIGNAVIDTDNGRLVVGIDSVLDKIKEELL